MSKIKRKMIKIDEDKCTGCSLCIPSCPEGALQIVDTPNGPKVRLVKEFFCDGLGACLGNCPEDALSVVEEEVEAYDERKVMENIVKGGKEKIKEHLDHLKDHGEVDYIKEAVHFIKDNKIDFSVDEYIEYVKYKMEPMHTGCPGTRTMELDRDDYNKPEEAILKVQSKLRNWPVQLMLVGPQAPYLKNAELLIAADCVPFAYASFHQDFIKDKVVLIGCPKLDDIEFYKEKLKSIFEVASPKSVTVLHMEVPCCFGLVSGVQAAIQSSGKDIPFNEITISVKGEVK